jgi:hypothetical protein
MAWTEDIEAAKKRVADMDAVDGFKDRQLTTIVCALRVGLMDEAERGCAFDAFVMLAELAGMEGMAT